MTLEEIQEIDPQIESWNQTEEISKRVLKNFEYAQDIDI